MKKNKLYIILFSLTLLLLLLPLTQQLTKFSTGNLVGEEAKVDMPDFSLKEYYNHNYQQDIDKYTKRNLGLRHCLIPIYNQIMWTLYHRTSNKTICIGLDGNLYEMPHLTEYFDMNDVNNPLYRYNQYDFEKGLNKLATIQDILSTNNVGFAYCINPTKPYVSPQYIPEKVEGLKGKIDFNPYTYIKTGQSKEKINFIDLNQWFVNIKDSVDFELFHKTAKHWSTLSSVMALDSLISYIEREKGIKMTHIDYSDRYFTNEYTNVDKDLERLLNLILPIPKQPAQYAHLKYIEPKENGVKPKVIVISDSYMWNIFNTVSLSNIFSDFQFWYYYNDIMRFGDSKLNNTKDIDIAKELSSADFVFVFSTPLQLGSLGWGFSKDALKKLQGDDDTDYELKQFVKRTLENMRNTPEWMKSLEKKAEAQNLPVDSIMVLDATWLYRNQ